MNSDEKRALFSFLSIYICSAIFLIGMLLYVYYQDEVESLEKSCSMELNNASMKIKTDILNSYMHNKKFIPKNLDKKELRYGLYDEKRKLIFSNLDSKESVDLDKKFYENRLNHYFIDELNEVGIPIKYIVLETCQGVVNKDRLVVYTILAFFLSAIFVGFIAFFLAKLLLKPVRQKVLQLDNFIKDSAHELNTPISVLMTSVSMLKRGKNPEKMMKYILSSSKQISHIYNDIHFSAFNNFGENLDERFNLNELILESVDFFRDISVTKSIIIEANLEICEVLMDRTKTQKLINNLLSNAIKYSKNNSKIVVSLEKGFLKVQDFGIGISKEEQKEIFKRYKRGKNVEGGFGIGLDIVNRICKDYNLELMLESKPNEGSTFIVDFNKIIISQ
ncbi:sensor histidine kinase [Halarcobacter ebronensis]|uniref:histidine kinase n=1 Tax=Halarcobacter ebronensis TaxID=1462615 RepID=A0A4Q1AQV6_9BACT|nr:HAMP domain-containing sensor histidine kinase [Halarcobacter ebronensis]QKF82481.1 two-component system sensor histidine kinase [Halarcobacter ebronensis]RXK07499.1 two-component sensor histidine kinase [Halarcobacter ebronensis]